MSGPALVPTLLALPPVLHLGALHGYEKLLVLLIAFGPFVVLGVVVYVVRRRDLAAEQQEAGARADVTGGPGPGERL
ncbi:hypothetical protein [Nocardioides mesophilus]|uniref:Uncharacterized protein n=1 Tax=Nocardioides mesophilus TaxID=433659 RepID=A0A7G9RDC2_9ACTN|nr:hypothetical protein [Nocardioides mesophilus]QNN53597.1 hypothetical protein H9L09_04000 [Nocardioides mesophilus]